MQRIEDLTPEQRDVIEHYQAYNVTGVRWFISERLPKVEGFQPEGTVEVIALGGDNESGFIWSFLIQPNGDYSSLEAPVGEWSTGIET